MAWPRTPGLGTTRCSEIWHMCIPLLMELPTQNSELRRFNIGWSPIAQGPQAYPDINTKLVSRHMVFSTVPSSTIYMIIVIQDSFGFMYLVRNVLENSYTIMLIEPPLLIIDPIARETLLL
ncbi:hypothetical protein VNO77_17299 [Canavalia gladiata]|uniref:Uncharacterized protein n=1 Tax=Canavalia gladiata TaxID=3824 RepID=A0AAN9QMK6_CANGL